MAWSLLREKIAAGLEHLLHTIARFDLKKDLMRNEYDTSRVWLEGASFLLGAMLERDSRPSNNHIPFGLMDTPHLASCAEDYAIAVMLQLEDYQIPLQRETMSPPDLVEDGLVQFERRSGYRALTKLPQGLFKLDGGGSFRCKPSLYLDTSRIETLRDVYGAFDSGYCLPLTTKDHIAVRFLGEERPFKSRLPWTATYKSAFGDARTAEVRDFMLKVGACSWWFFGPNKSPALSTWAGATLRGDISNPEGPWPSSAHEKAIFEEMLHIRDRAWDNFPEINHEQVCFELMCQFAGIHPQVARERDLGLVVKVDDPPALGFVDGLVYKGLEEIEERQRNDVPAPTTGHTRNTAIFPEDWLSVSVTNTSLPGNKKALVLETMKITTTFNPDWIGESPKPKVIPTYMAVGVWFWSSKDDPFIGAELTRKWDECDAVLL